MTSEAERWGVWVCLALTLPSCVALVTLPLSIIAVNRWTMDYGSEGRYFDPGPGIVYDIDGRLVSTVLAVAGWIVLLICLGAAIVLRRW